jgi:quercetin dioxygenase-like cupin family protein
MSDAPPSPFRSFQPQFRWQDVDHLPYKEDGSAPFKSVSRQILFADPALGCELRYFEVEAGGYSTLERHQHAHAVMILRGGGHSLVGDQVRLVSTHDLVAIPAWTWHQFRANAGQALGFLCMVNAERDRPQLPTAEDLETLRRNPVIAAFLG